MLTWLHVKNLALIEEEEIDFGEGLNILTGETGAGKSILLGSIALALGGRADADLVRQGADYCLVELAFRVDSEEQKKALDERGIRPEEDDTLLLRRRIYADKAAGRSSASVGGESVTLKELQEISDLFVEVSGQQENQRLLRREEQRDILDTYAGEEAKSLLSEVADAYEKYRTLERAAAETDLDEERAGREAELLAYEISELEQAGLVPGEDKTLEERHETLRHFEKITAALEEAQAALSEDGVTD